MLKSTTEANVPSQARQDDGFGQEILDQPSPARADRLAYRQFPLTHRATNLHHAGDVQADDQQHHPGQGQRDGLKEPELWALQNASGS